MKKIQWSLSAHEAAADHKGFSPAVQTAGETRQNRCLAFVRSFSGIASAGSIYQEYRDFCMRNGEWARSTADFYAAMDAAGFERHKTRAGIVVMGLRLRVL